jgi:hypothetical protein
MRIVCVVAGLAGWIASGVAMGQGPAAPTGQTGPAAEVQRSYAGLKANILKAADKMPAGDYQFKPAPEVRGQPYQRGTVA